MRASTLGRRLLVPDENVTWNATAIPKAISIARNEGIDVVMTTSPPGSVHLIGAAVQKATGAKWVADLRDSVAMHAHRSTEGIGARAKQKTRAGVAHLIARQADAIVCAAESIAVETRGLHPRGRVVTITNGCDFDDFAGTEYARADRFRLTHAGSFFGKRDPKPFLRALAESGLKDVTVRFLGDFRPGDREFMESLGLADRVELIDHVPRRESLRLQRDSDVLLLLIPEAGGRGRGVLSGKVFEYLAAERPVLAVVPEDGAAAQLIRDTGAGVVAGPEDVPAIREALVALHSQWRNGKLDGTPLSPEWQDKLARASRVEELAELLESLA
jgi:glycosyltransferase involved in cell wall biosynthesis